MCETDSPCVGLAGHLQSAQRDAVKDHDRFVPSEASKLREAEIAIGKGATVPRGRVRFGVTEQTYDRRRKEYGGLRLDQAARLKALEKENQRLKRIVADQSGTGVL